MPRGRFRCSGYKVITRVTDTAQQQGKRTKPVQDMERWSDEESFFTFLCAHPRRAALKVLKDPALTWDGLHAALVGYLRRRCTSSVNQQGAPLF